MALDPQSKSMLDKFTMVAKKIIYHPGRMQHFMQMLGTPEGAITAVQSVIAAMEKRQPVPPQILQLLGINIYLAMVDVAQESTGVKADEGVMKKVMGAILSKLQSNQPQQPNQQQQPTQAPQAAPQGILSSQMGVPA